MTSDFKTAGRSSTRLFLFLLLLATVFLGSLPDARAEGLYRIGVGDSLAVNVWDEPKLNGAYEVLPDGTITMPLAGTFRAEGYTGPELAHRIANRLSAVFRKKPEVTVTVKGMGNNFFYISGAVGKTGPVAFTHRIRLLQAIILAGGATPSADEDRVVLIRNNEPRTISIEKLDQGKDLSNNIPIHPQDIIIVPLKTDQIYLMGEVTAPGAYYFNKGMTVMQALIQAHGWSQFASTGSIRIIRKQKDGTKKIVHIDVDHIENEKKTEPKEFLHPGDLIYVPQRMF
ncbi:MAG: polysaccharide biosynthesis/export family protein [Nitrospirae bacterium]|nr:polysaccharide biosynthesis/export family protein [Nitrospirota bacterium]MCL5285428.1 polysaccharide biosynthesis/export family protein [Nitrospirota bacterium]